MTGFGKLLLCLFLVSAAALALMVRFDRPASVDPAAVGPAAPSASMPVPASALPAVPPAAVDRRGLASLAIPVAGVSPDALVDSFDDARGGGTRPHHAIDIAAPIGTPVIAAAPGRVEKLFDSELGGKMVYVRAAPDTVHYYGHLAGYAPDLAEGLSIRTGTPIGFVGATGDADPGAPHLHFGVKRLAAGEGWWQGTDVDPYPLLAGKAVAR
ncbi:M23 family metallopeptidase [Flavisphingomonas formosensis]|uniref:M23 family metallopeptidase n=1 Tax=Flavisphingomonas formosensis TaxID=861534 RepID=UPI001E38A600|nr:M23 family metallopeptidase [Sphingomonas formosensis]